MQYRRWRAGHHYHSLFLADLEVKKVYGVVVAAAVVEGLLPGARHRDVGH